MPNILFVHENYPAQFGQIADHLLKHGWNVAFATASDKIPEGKLHTESNGLKVLRYARHRDPRSDQHPYLVGTERSILNGQGATRIALGLRSSGFTPDLIVAHSGWGSGSFMKVVWPNARMIQYLEWWYHYPPIDAPEAPVPEKPEDKVAATLCRNLPFLLDAQSSDLILAPTEFQASRIPEFLRHRVHIQHDGIDTEFYAPSPNSASEFTFEGLPDDAPILTYATRGMEPLRGFPQFMAAASELQSLHPDLHVVIAGQDRISYGAKLPDGDSYKKRALNDHNFDQDRLHFTGLLPRARYRDLLRRSAVHVYLTRPFVLSWSLLEAMACGCSIVASDNDAVREVTGENSTALVDMDDHPKMVATVSHLLGDAEKRTALSSAARHAVEDKFSSQTCHAALTELFEKTVRLS